MLGLSSGVHQNYKIISRWMHKTLTDWQTVLQQKGADIMIYEEYIDFTTSSNHFDKFILLLSKHCPNLTHVRLLFYGEKSDCLEKGFIKSLLQLPNLMCLSLFDSPDTEIRALKTDFNQLKALKIAGFDENVSTCDLSNIFGSMMNLQSVTLEYKPFRNNKIVSSLLNLTQLNALSLYYAPESELKLLKNCNHLEKLHLYMIDGALSSADFLAIFKGMIKLHTLSICLIDSKLCTQISKLDEYCPQLIYLTINQQLTNIGDFVNLKYLRFDMDGDASFIFDTKQLVEILSLRYADRLQVLDISMTSKHTHTVEITKLKSLKAFLCSSWPRNMLQCLTQLEHLEFFSMETYLDDLDDSEEIVQMIVNCKNLRYLRLPYTKKRLQELIRRLPIQRNFDPESQFLLSFVNGYPANIEEKEHPCGKLLQFECNDKIFDSKLKALIASLGPYSEANTDGKHILKYPGKTAGDPIGFEDTWLLSMNYKLALKSCSNKHKLKFDQEMINQCRNTHYALDCNITNMQFAFNFKYDAIDEYNEYPKDKSE